MVQPSLHDAVLESKFVLSRNCALTRNKAFFLRVVTSVGRLASTRLTKVDAERKGELRVFEAE